VWSVEFILDSTFSDKLEFICELTSAKAFPLGKVARREIAVTDEGRAIVISIELLP